MSKTSILRFLPNNEYLAAVGANSPSASNVFATINDLTGNGGIYGGSGSTQVGTTIVSMADTDKLQFDSANGPLTGLFTVDAVNNRIGFGTASPGHGVHISTGDVFVDQGNMAIGSTAPASNYKLYIATDDADGNDHRGQRIVLGGATVTAAAQIAGLEIRSLNIKTATGTNNYRGVDINYTGSADGAGTYNMIGARVKMDAFTGSATINKYLFELVDGTEGLGKVLSDVSGTGFTQWVDPNTLVSDPPLTDVLTAGNTTANGQTINALNGGGQLDLRQGADNVIALTNAGGAYTKAWYYGDDSFVWLGFGSKSEVKAGASRLQLNTYVAGQGWTAISDKTISSGEDAGALTLATNTSAIKVFETSLAVNLTANAANRGVSINSSDVSWNGTMSNSVSLGMTGGVIKTANTVYVGQIGFSSTPIGGPFDLILNNVTSTADRTQTFQNASGTIALLSDIPAGSGDNIYNINGTLTSDRTVTMGAFDLIFNGGTAGNSVKIDSFGLMELWSNSSVQLQTTAGGANMSITHAGTGNIPITAVSGDVTLQGTGTGNIGLGISLPLVKIHLNGATRLSGLPTTAVANYVLRSTDALGTADWVDVTTLITGDGNIYDNDGSLTGNRTVTMAANSLTFNNTAVGNALEINGATTTTTANTLNLNATTANNISVHIRSDGAANQPTLDFWAGTTFGNTLEIRGSNRPAITSVNSGQLSVVTSVGTAFANNASVTPTAMVHVDGTGVSKAMHVTVGDVHMSGLTETNLLYVDYSADTVNIGSATGASRLTVTGGDIEVIDQTKGVILKDRTSGTRYRVYIDSTGTLFTEAA